jgi:FkbM family methyltransferase
MSGDAHTTEAVVWSTWRWIPRRRQFTLSLPKDDPYFIQEFERSGSLYESDVLLHIAHRGPRGGLFIDVGAHVGNHTLFFASFLAEHVIAVEPNPASAALLKENIGANDLENVTVVEVAVGRRSGYARLVLPKGPNTNTGMVSLEQTETGTSGPVQVTTLDELVDADPENLPVRLIKIDAEGMQEDVIRGATEVLRNYGPQLVIEAATDTERADLEAYLAPFGYENVARLADTPTYHFVRGGRRLLVSRRPTAVLYEELLRFARQIRRAIRALIRRTRTRSPVQ